MAVTGTERFVEVARTGDLAEGAMKMVVVNGKEVLLARIGDKFYAAENRCPHMGGNLSQGKLTGTIVTCPLHHSQFDLSDGSIVRWTDWSGPKLAFSKLARPPRHLKVYQVRIDADRVMVAGV